MTTPDLLTQAIQALDGEERDKAQILLARLLKDEPNNERAWLLMAEAQNDVERQKFCVERALKINPQNDIARQMLAELSGSLPAEADWVTQAEREVMPTQEEAAQATAIAPQPTDEPPVDAPAQLAVPETISPAAKTPAQLRETLELAVAMIERGQRAEGRALLETVVEVDPTNDSAWLWMAATSGDPDAKRGFVEKALAINPKSKMAQKMWKDLGGGELPKPIAPPPAPVALAPAVPLSAAPEKTTEAAQPVNRNIFPIVIGIGIVVTLLLIVGVIVVAMMMRPAG